MDDQRLHDLVRDSLHARSGDADTSPSAAARVAPSRRPRRALWVVGGAAVAVAATVTVVALAGEQVPRRDGDRPPAGETDDPAGLTEWRNESWRGLTVSVPADLGYGAAPVDRRTICSDRADQPGYVGRPLHLTDVCDTYRSGEFPLGLRRPFVWLGADLDAGRVELGSGWVQETIAAHGTTLTVASDDEALRERILASARPTDVCSAQLRRAPKPATSATIDSIVDFVPDRLAVCAYRLGEDGAIALSYGARSDEVAAQTWRAITEGRHERLRCTSDRGASEWVVLRFEGYGDAGSESLFQEMVFHLSGAACPRLQVDDGTAFVLTPELVEPWATGGIPAVVYGPTGGKGAMIDSFVGLPG